MNEGEGETVHGQKCSQMWTGSNGRGGDSEEEHMRGCVDRLWVCPQVHRPTGKDVWMSQMECHVHGLR